VVVDVVVDVVVVVDVDVVANVVIDGDGDVAERRAGSGGTGLGAPC